VRRIDAAVRYFCLAGTVLGAWSPVGVNTPWLTGKRKPYPIFMKDHKSPFMQPSQTSSVASLPAAAATPGTAATDYAPSADEVARRAYFSYLNHGSRPGHDVQHWLEAEAHLLAERKATRHHAFHNRT
jgi:hypothetical protein